MNDEEFDRVNIEVLEELRKMPDDLVKPPYIKAIITQILNDHKRIEGLERRLDNIQSLVWNTKERKG